MIAQRFTFFILGASFASAWWAFARFGFDGGGFLAIPVSVLTIAVAAANVLNHWEDKK